ncbi:MAG: energy transducer TonB [Flavipsychrobacter sp.]|nr:energy transducer TonB [Flavipsychrobacter sp.]
MELQSILKADYLDIIFDRRNKKYGGYELRKNYHRRATKSITIVLTTLLVGIGANTFASRFKSEEKIVLADKPPVVLTSVANIPEPEPEPIVPPPPNTNPEPPAQAATVAYTPPRIEPDDQVTTPPATVDDLRDHVAGTVNSDGNGGDLPATLQKPGDGTGEVPEVVETKRVVAEAEVYVDQMPEFNGDLRDYLARNIQYPEMARQSGTAGKVVIRFVVNEDGSISQAIAIKKLGAGCEEEALRVVNNMPRWKPGKQNGKAVKTYYTLPVQFKLN